MRRRLQIIQLGWPHFAVLVAGILSLLAVAFLFFPAEWQRLYVRYVAIPRLELKYGFKGGNVTVRRPSYSITGWGVANVTPGGRFARLGLRAGDVPFDRDGNGLIGMHDALVAAARGRFAKFDVINAADFSGGRDKDAFRTIVTNPPDTELADDFFGWFEGELPSPTGERTLRTVRHGDGTAELWVREVATGKQTKIYAFDLNVSVVWATDGRWVAVADYSVNGSRCVLLDARGGPSRNLSEALARNDQATRKHMEGDKDVRCDVFGRVRGTSRIALTLSGSSRTDPVGFREDFFYDVAAGKVVAAR